MAGFNVVAATSSAAESDTVLHTGLHNSKITGKTSNYQENPIVTNSAVKVMKNSMCLSMLFFSLPLFKFMPLHTASFVVTC